MAPRGRDGSGRARPAGSGEARLWAPWRYAYLRTVDAKSKRCIFCLGKLTEAERRRRLVLFDSRAAIAMLNLYPYNPGHLMVAPRRHVASLELLARAERIEIGELVAAAIGALRKTMRPAGFNVGANIGRPAGAGFADHLHWHIVPRWAGDTNFMPVTAATRVISRSLAGSYRELRPVFKALVRDLS